MKIIQVFYRAPLPRPVLVGPDEQGGIYGLGDDGVLYHLVKPNADKPSVWRPVITSDDIEK